MIVIIAIITNNIIFFTLLLNDKPLSKFLLCKTLISGLQYDSVWSCDTTRPSTFVIAASQGFRDSRTLLLRSLPSWYHPHLFRFFNFEIYSALKQEIQGSWDATLIVVSFVSRKEKIHHYSKKSMSASVVDANFPMSPPVWCGEMPIVPHTFLDNFESILQIACCISFIQCECTKKMFLFYFNTDLYCLRIIPKFCEQ